MIRSMSAYISEAQGYHRGFNEGKLVVIVSFDSKEFNKLKRKDDPLAANMAQIENVIWDAPVSMRQRYPRAKDGLITVLHKTINRHLN